MSFMRDPAYAYISDDGDQEFVNILYNDQSVRLPLDCFDALALMRYAQLVNPGKEYIEKDLQASIGALDRVDISGRGNFGSHAILEAMGENPQEDFKNWLEEIRRQRENKE